MIRKTPIRRSIRVIDKFVKCTFCLGITALLLSACSAKEAQPTVGLSSPSVMHADVTWKQSNLVSEPTAISAGAEATINSVRGIYVSGWSASGDKFQKLLHLLDQTDLNAMVIDIKNDYGQLTYPSQLPMVTDIGASSFIIKDLKEKLAYLKAKQIYTIARIVVFKDPYLCSKQSNLGIQTTTGQLWRDSKGVAWVDPYKEVVWDYNIQIAKEAAAIGFDEIQFDYVRFPDNGKKVDLEVNFDNPKGWSKAVAIQTFLKRAKEQLGNVPVSADVFGLTTTSSEDMGIGQNWSLMSKEVDTLSPMLYPSHYSSGIYGIPNPDLQPYAIVRQASMDAIAKNKQLLQASHKAAAIRPWFQDFTATWVKPHKTYGDMDVKEQIKAAREQGINQFLLWNSSSNYSYR